MFFQKTIIKVFLGILVGIIGVIYLKNTILYFTYKHGEYSFHKISPDQNEWMREIEIHPDLRDAKYIERYKFLSDDTGKYYSTWIGKKINGEQAKTYSFSALLPYDVDSAKYYESVILIDSMYIIYLPSEQSYNDKDTLYSKYLIRNDSLYVDGNRYNHKYSSTPTWEIMESIKADFIYLYTLF